jgi:hypothetical protein
MFRSAWVSESAPRSEISPPAAMVMTLASAVDLVGVLHDLPHLVRQLGPDVGPVLTDLGLFRGLYWGLHRGLYWGLQVRLGKTQGPRHAGQS